MTTPRPGNALQQYFYGLAVFDGTTNARVSGTPNVAVARAATGVYTVETGDSLPEGDIVVDAIASGANGAACMLRVDADSAFPTIGITAVDPAGVPVNTEFTVRVWTLGKSFASTP